MDVNGKKPLFKRKQFKEKSQRKGNYFDQDTVNVKEDGERLWKPKSKLSIRAKVTEPLNKQVDILKWKAKETQDIDESISTDNLEEGDIIAVDFEQDNNVEIKYVPQWDTDEQVSHRAMLSQLSNEYENDEYDMENANTNTNYTTVDFEPLNDLPLNNDDLIAVENVMDQDKYDLQLSDTEENAIKIIQPLTVAQELEELSKLLKAVKLKEVSATTQLQLNQRRMTELEDQRLKLLQSL